MSPTMAAQEIAAFLSAEFPQVVDKMVHDRLDDTMLHLHLHLHLHLRLAVSGRHLRPGGTISGPSMLALADVAAFLAILARISPVALAVTTGATIDFLRKPAPHSDLRAEARVLDLGRVLADALTCSVPPPR